MDRVGEFKLSYEICVQQILRIHISTFTLSLFLLLFVFNIYVLAVVITVISSVRRAITNDQKLTKYSRLCISNTFLSILAVPNKAVFCITPTLHVIPSFPIHLSNTADTLPTAPITTGKISTFLNFHNLPISFFKSWYFSTFFFLFPLLFSSTLLYSSSDWIFMPHSTLISSFSTAPSGACPYHFSLCSNTFFLQIFQ